MVSTNQKQMLFWTSVLVVALGVVSVMILLQPPPQSAALSMSPGYARVVRAKIRMQNAAIGSTVKAPKAAESRNPASSPGLVVDEGLRATDILIPCHGSTRTQLDDGVNQARLSGRICGPGREIASSEIKNITNGTSATVFFPTPKAYTTDYIALEPGDNQIKIVHSLKGGDNEELNYVLVRQVSKKTR